jgi:GMP synthase-like glutamine amidotransferase
MQEMRIAVIDNSLDHFIYNPIRHWKIWLDFDFKIFKATENHFPDAGDFTHLILSGSEASVLHREKWAQDEIELIKQASDKNVSLLGSCYGHQLLAVALAGPQHVRRSVPPEIGWIPIDINGVDSFLGAKRRAYCFSSHLDEVVKLPDEFVILASSACCQIQAFRQKNRSVWGLQIHPEMNISEAQRYLENRVAYRHEPLQLFHAALNSRPQDSGIIRHVLKNFLR